MTSIGRREFFRVIGRVGASLLISRCAPGRLDPAAVSSDGPSVTPTRVPPQETFPTPTFVTPTQVFPTSDTGTKEWEERPSVGLIGSIFITQNEVPQEMLRPLSPEAARGLRFIGGDGSDLAYGVFREEEFESFDRVHLHMRFRGILIGGHAPSIWGPGYNLSDKPWLLFDIPYFGDRRQYMIVSTAIQDLGGPTIYSVRSNNPYDTSFGIKNWNEVYNIMETLPEGTSVILAIPIHVSSKKAYWGYGDEVDAEADRVIKAIKDGEVVFSEWPLGAYPDTGGYDAIYLDSKFLALRW